MFGLEVINLCIHSVFQVLGTGDNLVAKTGTSRCHMTLSPASLVGSVVTGSVRMIGDAVPGMVDGVLGTTPGFLGGSLQAILRSRVGEVLAADGFTDNFFRFSESSLKLSFDFIHVHERTP